MSTELPERSGAKVPPERIRELRDALQANLVEREVAVRLALLAALAGEHLLLVGPPGTAKSLVARRLRLAFADTTYFERLLTRFSVPEELFGPLSIKGLEEDRYERLTNGYLPTASVAFLDEIFKANSAILNALLTLLNEREFDNGTRRERTPLIAVIGASNELPEGEELDALFDRFLLRLHVGPVTKEGFSALIGLRGEPATAIDEAMKLTTDDVADIQRRAAAVEVPGDVVALLHDLRDWCLAEAIAVSDRRWRKIVKLLQVTAATNGRETVSIWDGWVLQHCIWDDPDDRLKVYDWYAARVGTSGQDDATRLTAMVLVFEVQLTRDQESRSQARDAKGRPLFVGSRGRPTLSEVGEVRATRGTEALYLRPKEMQSTNHYYGNPHAGDRSNGGAGYTLGELDGQHVSDPHRGWVRFQHWERRAEYLASPSNRLMVPGPATPWMEPTRQKEAYIKSTLRELEKVRSSLDSYRASLQQHIARLQDDIRSHLWVSDDFADPAARSLDQTRATVDGLRTRVGNLIANFGMLPLESDPRMAVEDEDSSNVPADDEAGDCVDYGG